MSLTAAKMAHRSQSYPPCPEVPAGADFADAWQMACQHLSKRFVLSETLCHPVVMQECYDLACMMLAYGLVPKRVALPEANKARTKAVNDVRHRVIVVDDAPDVLVSVGAFLLNADFTVTKAGSGDEALRVIASDPRIDVLVTDFAMPGLNGADLIRQAKEVRPSLRAVVITGYPNADGLAALPPGTTVLAKPFRRGTLVAAVEAVLRDNANCRTENVPETISSLMRSDLF